MFLFFLSFLFSFFLFPLFAHTHHPLPFLFSFSVLTIRESVPQNCLMWFIFEVMIVDGRGFPDTECTLALTYTWIKRKGSRVYVHIVRVSVCEPYCAHSLMHYFWWTRWICLGSVWCTGIHILEKKWRTCKNLGWILVLFSNASLITLFLCCWTAERS